MPNREHQTITIYNLEWRHVQVDVTIDDKLET